MFPKLPGEDFINSWYPILIALGMGLVFGLRLVTKMLTLLKMSDNK